MDWRPQPDDPSGAVFWLTVGAQLIDGEETTSLEKLALAVDAANGVGSALDITKFVFMNTDTSVHLHRAPSGGDSRCGHAPRSAPTASG